MKGYYRHILLASAALLAVVSCTKQHIEENPSDLMPISINAVDGTTTKALLNNGTFKTPGTKALLTEDTFGANGNRIQVYDYVTGRTSPYINDQIGPEVTGNNYGFTEVWPFVNGPHQWTPGTHKFFGWLAEDANMTSATDAAANTPEEFFGTGFNFYGDDETEADADKMYTLTIPAKEMTAATPQFDFMYSDIYTTEPINTPVQLNFSHLFCAVSFGISNGDTQDIEINSLTISTYNSKSATIDFSGDAPQIIYSTSSTSTGVFRNLEQTYTIPGGGNYDNAFASTSSEKDFRILWPMTYKELEDCRITITYLYKSDNAQFTKELSFPDPNNEGWLAGNKYHYSISLPSLKTTPVTIKCEVCPWDTENTDITFN